MTHRPFALSAFFIALSASAPGQAPPTWVRLGPPGTLTTGAWDSARERVVFTGGSSSAVGAPAIETWEWNGRELLQHPANGPTARSGHAMAYDPQRRRLVLFGGLGPRGHLSDTWEFDGVAWAMVSSSGPPARSGHAMAFDGNRNRVVLTGGDWGTSPGFQDCWEWDGATWTPLPGIGAPRARHGMVYDPLRRRLVVHSGERRVPPLYWSTASVPETLEFDGVTWQVVGTGPTRVEPATTFDAQRGKVLLYAGLGSPTGTDLWEWDGATWSAIATANTPRPLSRTSLVFDPVRNESLLAAHDYPVFRSTLWTLAGNRWRLEIERPGKDKYQATGFHEATGKVVMFGGRTPTLLPPFPDETWTFDGSRWTGAVLTPSPPVPAYGTLAYDRARARLVLLDGQQPSMLWSFDGTRWQVQQTATAPPPREAFLTAYDAGRDRVILFGGIGAGRVNLFDTWEFDGATWTQVVSATVPPDGYSMLYADAIGMTLMFAQRILSFQPVTMAPEAWGFDGNTWRIVAPASPSMSGLSGGRYAMGYDRGRGVVIAMGGNGSTWELRGSQWVSVPLPRLPETPNLLLYDSVRGEVVHMGNLPVALTTRPGGYTALRTGCTAGAAVLHCQRARSGDPTWLDVIGALPAQPGLMAVSMSSTSTTIFAECPFFLGSLEASVLFMTNPAGFATVGTQVPASLALRGSNMFLQAAVLAPRSALGFALSAGVRITIGD